MAQVVGDAATLSGIALGNLQQNQSAPASTTGIVNSANMDIVGLQSMLASVPANTTVAYGNLWNPLATTMSNALTESSIALGDLSNTSAFISDATNTANFLNAVVDPLTNYYYGIGGVSQNITETASSTAAGGIVTTNSDVTPFSNISSGISQSADGTSSTITTLNSSGGVSLSQTNNIDNFGNITNNIQSYNLDGSIQYTQTANISTTGVTTATISGQGEVCTLDDAGIAYTSLAHGILDGTGNTVTLSQGNTLEVGGANNTVNGGQLSESITVDQGATGNLFNLNNSTITSTAGTSINVTGFNNGITLGTNGNLTLTGTYNTIQSTVGGANYLIDFLAGSAQNTVSVNNSTIEGDAGVNLNLTGNNNHSIKFDGNDYVKRTNGNRTR